MMYGIRAFENVRVIFVYSVTQQYDGHMKFSSYHSL